MTYADAISQRLENICKEQNISHYKLAVLSGVTQSTIEDIITGRTKNPTLKTLHRISVGLNMTVSEFLDFKELNEYILEDE